MKKFGFDSKAEAEIKAAAMSKMSKNNKKHYGKRDILRLNRNHNHNHNHKPNLKHLRNITAMRSSNGDKHVNAKTEYRRIDSYWQ